MVSKSQAGGEIQLRIIFDKYGREIQLLKPPDMPIWRCRDVARREFDLVSGWQRPGRAHGFGGLRSPRQLPPFTSVVSGIFLLE